MRDSDRPAKPVAPTRRGALTRAKLIEAGRKAFSAYGYEIARIADVARLAGVSHGNFYRHFTDKDDLLHAVLAELHQDLHHPVSRRKASRAGGILGELIDYNTSFFHTYAEHRDMLRVAREAAARPRPSVFLDIWLEMRRPFIERNRRWMEKLQAKGLVDTSIDSALMAESLGSMIEQLAYVHVGLPRERPSDERLDELGEICGIISFRSIFANATAELGEEHVR
ncbi:TetR/AcrR family transcriptional regulator [Novosphingobium pentaromativorans]|uniref:HTH tetR-type domain-containing protein n=1 Tax=Novosphingobium pentaromativorans US6-1 TaxID=1088721 RepID=G6E813_9SPHN|nr:TetR/AcrR family transcriptional regulator [Novosphingobium pentaromativorans]AIT81473.1 hypothetical protein JI59_17675 [Novosphingobium pentaromativorans US6-1]EHJ62656.1 hypothetical protein NSU_0484 [Novosphingobium pentaromativorans US6-1]